MLTTSTGISILCSLSANQTWSIVQGLCVSCILSCKYGIGRWEWCLQAGQKMISNNIVHQIWACVRQCTGQCLAAFRYNITLIEHNVVPSRGFTFWTTPKHTSPNAMPRAQNPQDVGITPRITLKYNPHSPGTVSRPSLRRSSVAQPPVAENTTSLPVSI